MLRSNIHQNWGLGFPTQPPLLQSGKGLDLVSPFLSQCCSILHTQLLVSCDLALLELEKQACPGQMSPWTYTITSWFHFPVDIWDQFFLSWTFSEFVYARNSLWLFLSLVDEFLCWEILLIPPQVPRNLMSPLASWCWGSVAHKAQSFLCSPSLQASAENMRHTRYITTLTHFFIPFPLSRAQQFYIQSGWGSSSEEGGSECFPLWSLHMGLSPSPWWLMALMWMLPLTPRLEDFHLCISPHREGTHLCEIYLT
jgi:hypothetical protein